VSVVLDRAAKAVVWIAAGLLLSVFYMRANGLFAAADDLRDGALLMLVLSFVLGATARLLKPRLSSIEKRNG
jgi:hypothetical protein